MKCINIWTISLLIFLFLDTASAEDIPSQRFQIIDNSIVVDSHTGLMWALQDNGKDIDWWDATNYCENFEASGYTDWRLPDIKELSTLYTSDKSNKDGYFIAAPIQITECCLWSSYDTMGGALIFSFKSGKKPAGYLADTHQLRALPVRGTSKIELDQYKNFKKQE